jgi:TPR repeat protein
VDLLAELQLADRTIARRWPIHANWAAATPAVGVPTSAVEAQRLAVTPPRQPMPAQRQSSSEEIAILVKRGKGFIGNGDPVGARVMLRRAAESKNAEAALMLAATYDPVVLRELKVYGVAADVAMARTWYEKAKEFGSKEAPHLLEILASATR